MCALCVRPLERGMMKSEGEKFAEYAPSVPQEGDTMIIDEEFNSLDSHIDAYCDLLAGRGRKESTVADVRNALRKCFAWLAEEGVASVEGVTPEHVARMAQDLPGRESSRRQWLSGLSGFMKWSTGRDVVGQARILWNPRGGESRTWITPEEYRQAMELAGPAERVMLSLAATMGLRRAEVASLRLSDFEDGEVVIRGKGHGPEGKKVRKLVSEPAREALEAWLAVRPASDSDALLVKESGRPMDFHSIYYRVRRLSERAGIPFSMHTFRRLYATTLADAGVPLETIARMMRHESPVTTMRCYLRADPRRMADAQAKVDAVLALRGARTQMSMPINTTTAYAVMQSTSDWPFR